MSVPNNASLGPKNKKSLINFRATRDNFMVPAQGENVGTIGQGSVPPQNKSGIVTNAVGSHGNSSMNFNMP